MSFHISVRGKQIDLWFPWALVSDKGLRKSEVQSITCPTSVQPLPHGLRDLSLVLISKFSIDKNLPTSLVLKGHRPPNPPK